MVSTFSSVRRTSTQCASVKGITPSQANSLKHHSDTPEGRRNQTIMNLLLNERVGVKQLCALRTEQVDLVAKRLHLPSGPVSLSAETSRILAEYLAQDTPSAMLIQNARGGYLSGGLSTAGLYLLLKELGDRAGVPNLTPSMCHAYREPVRTLPTTLLARVGSAAAHHAA